MARSKQSLKRRRTDNVKAARNRSRMRTLRTALKKVEASGDSEDKAVYVRQAQSLIDRAARRRLIHPNKAKRLKNSLMQ